MPIEFRCPNISGFDATLGKYVKCNQLVRVSSKRVGENIPCPKCSQEIEVPQVSHPLAKRPVQNRTGAASDESAAQPKTEHYPEHDQKKSIMDLEFQSESGSNDFSLASREFEHKRCPKCGGRFSADGVCTLCHFVEPIQKAERQLAENLPAKPAGFQLWLKQLAEDGNTMKFLGMGLFIMSVLFCLILIVVGIVSTSIGGVVLAVAAGFVLFYLCSIVAATWRISRQPSASLGPLAPFWNLLLYAARYLDWQKYDSRFAGRRIVDRRKSPIDDSQIASIEGLEACQVLDLEGSSITDAGLRDLYGHHHLRCLVLKRTGVTAEGVARLQQAIPRLWIWY